MPLRGLQNPGEKIIARCAEANQLEAGGLNPIDGKSRDRCFWRGSRMPRQARDRKRSALWEAGEHRFEDAYLTRRRVQTNIQMFRDEKADESWFIAMSTKPSHATVQAYAKRWGIEVMLSDLTSRAFGLAESQLRSPGKLNRLIMVITIVLYWAVSITYNIFRTFDGDVGSFQTF